MLIPPIQKVKARMKCFQFGIWARFWRDAGTSNNFAAQYCDKPAKRQKPGYPLQFLGPPAADLRDFRSYPSRTQVKRNLTLLRRKISNLKEFT
jgi:hypothetical protein